MPVKAEKSGVFLSYPRADGEARAAELRERITREPRDIVIKLDRERLEGGRPHFLQLEERAPEGRKGG